MYVYMAFNQVVMMATFFLTSSLSSSHHRLIIGKEREGEKIPTHAQTHTHELLLLTMGMCATGHWSVMQSCPPIITPICNSCSLFFTMPHPAARSKFLSTHTPKTTAERWGETSA
jgi:hypothetical protein